MPTNNIVIEDKEINGTPTMMGSLSYETRRSMEPKSPSPPIRLSSRSNNSPTRTPTTPLPSESRTSLKSSLLTTYQTNMERTIRWIHKLEDELDKQDKIVTNDLKIVKEQFQIHENFMINLTKDQSQIGQVLEEGNRLLLKSTNIELQPREENEIKEQMKILNRQWESLRSKALDRQST
ncbi:unnamed protein product [Rotaria sp. Silwood2]|nr:unnamed protein product [Rotaria sp. Silwood2]